MLPRRLTWNKAAEACRAVHKDAHLLAIRSAREQQDVAGMLTRISSEWHIVCIFSVVLAS